MSVIAKTYSKKMLLSIFARISNIRGFNLGKLYLKKAIPQMVCFILFTLARSGLSLNRLTFSLGRISSSRKKVVVRTHL